MQYTGEGNDYAPQHSCLENSTDRGAGVYHPRGHKELQTTEQLTLSIYHRCCYSYFTPTEKTYSTDRSGNLPNAMQLE